MGKALLMSFKGLAVFILFRCVGNWPIPKGEKTRETLWNC